MNYITYILLFIALGISQMATAQYAYFPNEGTITFDKTIHAKNLLKRHIATLKDGDLSRQYFEGLVSKVPETVVVPKKFSFRGNEMSLEPIEKEQTEIVKRLLQMGLLDYGALIYQNLDKKQSMMYMEMGGSEVAIQDSLTNVTWKLTNEYRNIAGYDCRRANGVTLDSVYVVAFYTDQIPISAGPSTVHGLPGMILGLAIPEQHYNMYASKVELSAATVKSDIFKKKAKAKTRTETTVLMKQAFGQWINDKQFGLIIAAMFL